MAIRFIDLPAPQTPGPLDFTPVQRTINDARQGMDQQYARDQNRLLGGIRATKGNRAASNAAFEQGNLEVGNAFATAANQEDDRKVALRERAKQRIAGIAQSVLEAPEELRGQLWNRVRALDPNGDEELRAAGIDPNDWNAGARMIIAEARGYQDPLDRQKAEAQIEQARAAADQSRAHANYYRTGGAQSRAPSGYRFNQQTDGYEIIPGGPADPEVIAQQAQARGNKNRTLSANDIGKLTDNGQTFQNLMGFNQTFKTDYGGLGVGGYGGDSMTAAARYGVPGFGGYKAAAEWWQNYDRHKNVVRNDLFGAALTPNEKEEFDKADVNPNMDPALIQKNLARQQTVMASAIRRRIKSMAAAGYQQQPVEEAYGITLPELDAALADWDREQAARKQTQQPTSPPATPQVPQPPAAQPQIDPQILQLLQRTPPQLAPDNNYYIPDPNRPGKYIQVIP